MQFHGAAGRALAGAGEQGGIGRFMTKTSDHREPPQNRVGEFPAPISPYLFHLIATITRFRDARLDKALKPLGLNVTRYQALTVIARLAPCTMSELADLSAIDRTTLTRIVDQLVARDLTQRATPSEDRRQVVLTLTAKGQAVYLRALRAIGEVNRTALEGLAEDTLGAIERTHQALVANLAPDPGLARRLLNFRPD